MKSDDDEVENEKKRLHNTITELQNSIKKSSASYDSLVKANTELMKYKEMVAGNENSDLIISLSKSLKKEKEANDLLKKQNKDLTDSLSTYTKGQKSGQNKQEVKPAEKPKQSGENSFALPTDGK